jgi:hypothetical protein
MKDKIYTEILRVDFEENVKNVLKDLIGKSLKQAEKIAQAQNLLLRITKNDDEYIVCSCEYRSDRINIELKDGKVVKAMVS